MSNTTEWVQVGELADSFAPDANILKYTNELAGKTLDLHMENGWVIRHAFETADKLTWEIIEGEGVGEKAEETYTATSIRDGIYFVDFIKAEERATSVSIVLNTNTGNATALIGQMPDEAETMRPAYQRASNNDPLTPVAATPIQATINKPFTPGAGHPVTNELIGKRVQYEYNPKEFYEHIYLNQKFYTWHCLEGVEKDLTDTDLCHYFKIADNLYYFIWQEKIIPTLGVIMIDLDRKKTTGKIVGYDGRDFNKLNNFPVGAYLKVLNETEYQYKIS